MNDRQTMVTIEFRDCRSPQLPAAIVTARQLGCTDSGGKIYRVQVPVDVVGADLDLLGSLYKLVSKWQSTRVTISGPGAEMKLPELLKKIAEVRRCHSRRIPGNLSAMYCSRQDSPAGDAACFGCRMLEGLSRLPDYQCDHLAWWQFGRLSEDLSTFTVDKAAIAEYLRSRGQSQVCTLCPAFAWSAVDRDIASLPDQVDLSGQSPFCLAYSKLDPLKAIGIGPRQRKYAFTDERDF